MLRSNVVGNIRVALPASLVLVLSVLAACGDAGPSEALNPPPVLVEVLPSAVVVGSGATSVLLRGSGFVAGTRAQVEGADRQVTLINSAQLQVTLTESDLATAGVARLTVENPAPGGGRSNAVDLSIAYATPVVTAVSPSTAFVDDARLALTIDGAGFAPASRARWNGVALPTTFVSATRLTAEVLGADLARGGAASVDVVTPAPGGGTSMATSVQLQNPRPVVDALAPDSVPPGVAVTVTISGSHFVPGATVTWNAGSRAPTFVDAGTLRLALSAADVAQQGIYGVSVINPLPGGGMSGTAALRVKAPTPPPTIASVIPASVTSGSSAFNLTVLGANFGTGARVYWNGAARATTVIAPTQLTAAIPASDVATAGTVSVTVVDATTGATSAALTVVVSSSPVVPPTGAPVLASVTPASAPSGGNPPGYFDVTLTGTGFTSSSIVLFDGTTSVPTSLVSPTTLRASLSPSLLLPLGAHQISVRDAGKLSNALPFTVNGPFGLAPLSPLPGATGGTLLQFRSDPGTRWIDGLSLDFTQTSTTRIYVQNVLQHFHVQVYRADYSGPVMAGEFRLPNTFDRLQVGTWLIVYPELDDSRLPGMSWHGFGRGCANGIGQVVGSFAIDTARYVGTTLDALDLRYVYYCEVGFNGPVLKGYVRWRASDPALPPGALGAAMSSGALRARRD